MNYKRSIKEISLTLEECRKKQHTYLEASAPIIKEISRVAAISIPKVLLHTNGTLEIKHEIRLRKLIQL